jgi:hypothetical protein
MFKNVYFLNYKELSEKLSRDQIDNLTAVKHFIWTSVIFGVPLSVPIEYSEVEIFSEVVAAIFTILEFVACIIINYYGAWSLYNANSQGDGKEFFKRMACLVLPISIYILLIALPVILILKFILPVVNYLEYYGVFDFLLIIILFPTYYWLMRRCLMYVSLSANIESPNESA